MNILPPKKTCPTDHRRSLRPCARILALILLLALALALLCACAPRGTYTNALGASYTLRGKKYTHEDAYGVKTAGRYEIDGGYITFSPKGGTPYALPFSRSGDTLTIGDLVYTKSK